MVMKKNRMNNLKRVLSIFLLSFLCISHFEMVKAEESDDIIEIHSAKDLLQLAEDCKLDIYSLGKTVELKGDISLLEKDFTGIPYFNGVFKGNGYTISGVDIKEKGSQIGVFRYIGELGIISNLNVKGAVIPAGSQVEVGGIAGVNYGMIKDCYFEGTVCGVETVGAITGMNKSMGKVLSCNSNAVVLATDYTGGIVGVNEGIVDDCINKSRVNIEELETVLDLGGIDIGTLNLTQNVVTRNNMGGIAGKSSGVISNCRNYGEIGFAHTGYNVGGIAGSQNGVIYHSTNDGKIYGRKDVGGIVGQAEPYVESEYLSDQLEQTKNDLDRMNRTLTSMSNSLEASSNEAQEYAKALSEQYEATNEGLNDRLDQMENAIPKDNKEAEECMNNISTAQEKIQDILDANTDGVLSKEERDELKKQQQIIEDNTKRLDEITREESGSTTTYEPDEENLTGLTNALLDGIDTIIHGVDRLNTQANQAVDHIYDNTAVIRGEKDFISDVSSIKNAADMDGVISNCINRGNIEGDINVGGIAGTMNIEYDEDPEADFNPSEDIDIATSSKVNDVILSSINYGKVKGKKNYLGSIVGLQEFGLIHGCEGYGHVSANAGSYIGGIAGKSGGTIEKSYSMADLSGTDYIGGIVGEGASVIDCFSIEKIVTEGERIGGIAGYLEEGGTVANNFFVKEHYDGIDNISYYGIAEPKAYEEIMQFEGVPKGFKRVCVSFELEDELISERMVAYGSSLSKEDFPILVERTDSYPKWPDDSAYTDIHNNVTITAEYIPWNQSIASTEELEGKSLFIAVENFYEEDYIQLQEASEMIETGEGKTVLYQYGWSFVSEEDKEFEAIEGHFYIPTEYRDCELEVWAMVDNQWLTLQNDRDGSYLVAQLPFEAPFAVVKVNVEHTATYFIIGGAIVIVLLVIAIIIVHNRRKKRVKSKEVKN